MSCDVGEVTERLENEQSHRYRDIQQSSFFNLYRHFTYATTHSPTLPSLYLCHSSFSNSSVASPTSQFILQPFFRFSYVTSSAHSPTFPSLRIRHNSFSNPSVALPTSQLILQPFRCFIYVPVHSPTLLLLYLRHSSFSNLSVTSTTPQLILQPFRRFTYVTVHSLTLPLLHLRHGSFSNPSFDSPTSQALHLRHLVSRPCSLEESYNLFLVVSNAISYSLTI